MADEHTEHRTTGPCVSQVHFVDDKAGIDETRDLVFTTPITDDPIGANWDNAEELADCAVTDLEKSAEAGIGFADLPPCGAAALLDIRWPCLDDTLPARNFVAGWARGHGLARAIALDVEVEARSLGISVINLDVRETQIAAVQLYQSLGYKHCGTHPRYAKVDGQWVAGLYFWKDLSAA